MDSFPFPEPMTGDYPHIVTSTPPRRPRHATDDSKYPIILPTELGSPDAPIFPTASTLDNNQEKVWQELTTFYLENEEAIEKSLNFDVRSIDKASELDAAMSTFLETADVILRGLVALSCVHPVLGIAIFAFHGVISLDMTRRDNNRKVIAVKLQMQNMMCSMFQLRKLRHIHVNEGKRAEEQSRLQRLIKAIAEEIKACGSDLNYYLDRKFISKMINAKGYQSRFAEHVETFARRRSELQSTITSYIAAGIDAANIAITEVNYKVTAMDVKLDAIVKIFKKLDTPREHEVVEFIEENGGAKRCVEKDELFTKFLAKAGEYSTTGKMLKDQDLMEMRDMLKAEVKVNYMDFKKELRDNLARFERLLVVQNNNLRDELVQQRHEMRYHSTKLDQLFQTSVLILEEGKLIRKATASRLTPNFKDPDLQYIWDLMGLKGSVKAKTFVLTFRDHLLANQSLSSSPVVSYSASSSFDSDESFLFSADFETPKKSINILTNDFARPEMEDSWVLHCINVAHVQPIVEALDEDGSGFISVKEANKFAGSRPMGWSFLRWIAYWAMGWHINITTYRSKIYWIVQQMHEALLSAHPANRSFVDEYLNHSCFNRIEALLRSIKPLPDNARKDSRVSEIAESMVTLQESRLKANLTEISFIIESIPDVALVTGLGRVETWILPLLYLLLRRHLDIIKLAQKRMLHEKELASHVKSLMAIFSVFDERIQHLESIFLQVHRNSRTQFESFAYGMFYASVHSKEKKPSENTLLTFKDNKATLEEIQESFSSLWINPSILKRGRGRVFEFEDVDLTQPPPPRRHIPHPLEGVWTGKCIRANNQQITFQGFFHCVIGPVINGAIVGKGESYLGPVEIEGIIEDRNRRFRGNIVVDFRINSDLYADLWCRGEYNSEKEVIHGQWVIEDDSGQFPPADDNDKEREMDFRIPCGRLYMTRTPPSVFRFRHILDSPDPILSTLTIAQRRWMYACKAVTFQLQSRADSPNFLNFLRAGTVERRKWVELTIRRELDKTFTDTKPQLSEDRKNALWALRLQVHPTNGRLYDLLALYLFKRMFYNVGSYFCHSCHRRIIFERYQCITCMNEDLSSQIDLCADCIEMPNLSSESQFAHDLSHSLIRSKHRIHECELASMIPQARLRSERIKSSFRAVEAKGTALNTAVDADQETHVAPDFVPFRCVCCSENITLPCWVCVGCALDTFICLDCDVKRRPVSGKGVQAAAHSYGHPLLRLYNSAEAKPVEVKSGRLERHLQEMENRINGGLSSLEERVNVQLDQVKVQMQAVVDEVGRRSTPTRFGPIGIDVETLPNLLAEENKAKHQSHKTRVVGAHAQPYAGTNVSEDRITALETKMEQRFHSLETKVDTQLNVLLSLMRQVVADVAIGRQA